MHALKPFQFKLRTFDRRSEVLHIHLNHLVADTTSGILHIDGDLHRTIGIYAGRTQAEFFHPRRLFSSDRNRSGREALLGIHIGTTVANVVIHDGEQLRVAFGPGLSKAFRGE